MKRILSAVLCAVLLLALMPLLPQTVSAGSLSKFDIRLTEPVASYTPDFSAEFSTNAQTYANVTWQENSPGFNVKLNSNDEFRAGLAYKVEIWVLLGDGNYLATDAHGDLAAALTVNGKAITFLKINGRNDNGQINEVTVTCEYGPLAGSELTSVLIKGVPTPVAGNMPGYSFTIGSSSYGFYNTEPVVWRDASNNFKQLDSSDTFIKGHKYQLCIWLYANREGGFTFKTDKYGNPQVSATINSWAADKVNKAYEQDGREVIEIFYTFPTCPAAHTCAPKLVPLQKQTCVLPGFKAYYECSCGKCYEDAAGKKAITDLDGYGIIPADGHKAGAWSYNGTHHYRKCTTCKEVIPGTNAAHSGGTASCLQLAKCSVCAAPYGKLDLEHRWGPGWDYKDASGHAWVCADCKTHSEVQAHKPGPAATETTPQKCTECGYVIQPAKNHTHKLTKVEAVPATCLKEGVKEHYTCSGCSDLFTDAKGKNKIQNANALVQPVLKHAYANPWEHSETEHWMVCKHCKEPMPETRMRHDLQKGKCSLCGYAGGTVQTSTTTGAAGSSGTSTGTDGNGTSTGTSDTDKPSATGTPSSFQEETDKESGNRWLMPVLVGVVFFAAAIVTAVLVLKKKKN